MEVVLNSEEALEEELNLNKITIIGTYSGGCGYGAMIKRKILEDIKKDLIEKYAFNENQIIAKAKNIKESANLDNYSIPGLEINFDEFNIFLFYKSDRTLIGTSSRNLSDFFFDYLAGIIGASKSSFMEKVSKKISDRVQEIDNQHNLVKKAIAK
jgi:hypothetical protein